MNARIAFALRLPPGLRFSPTNSTAMYYALLMILSAALFRLMPHPENVAPVAAIALMGGMYLGRKTALWVPLAALAATDLLLNVQMGYPAIFAPRLIDYAVFLGIGGLGLAARNWSLTGKTSAALATPFLFFLLSNLGVWMFGLSLANTPYPHTFSGLVECYVAALPFLRGTLVGDWAFLALFASVMAFAHKRACLPQAV